MPFLTLSSKDIPTHSLSSSSSLFFWEASLVRLLPTGQVDAPSNLSLCMFICYYINQTTLRPGAEAEDSFLISTSISTHRRLICTSDLAVG